MEGDIREVVRVINNIIRSKHVKGIVVGYPLDD
jgi:RNase H-fold protein (predicted Holliday junction resolvase)